MAAVIALVNWSGCCRTASIARSAQYAAFGCDGHLSVIAANIAVATRASTPFEGHAGASFMMSSSNVIQRSMATRTPSLRKPKITAAQASNIPSVSPSRRKTVNACSRLRCRSACRSAIHPRQKSSHGCSATMAVGIPASHSSRVRTRPWATRLCAWRRTSCPSVSQSFASRSRRAAGSIWPAASRRAAAVRRILAQSAGE